MDFSTEVEWFRDMEMEDPALLYQCQMDLLNESVPQPTCNFSSFHNTPNQFSQPQIEKPANILSFGNNSNTSSNFSQPLYGNLNFTLKSKDEPFMINFSNDYGLDFSNNSQRVRATAKTPQQAKQNVVAERKNRERLNQRFIALLPLLPSLKKLDKASILEDATKYIKQLQEDVKALEEEARKNPVESAAVHVKKSRTHQLVNPEIEVKVCDNNVHIWIYCKKQNGYLGKIFDEIENFHLIVINSSVMPFGNTNLAINIIAQMDAQFPMEAKDLEKGLRSAFQDEVVLMQT